MLFLNLKKICLIGHSRGGGIVLIKAEESKMVTHVITWAGVSDFKVRFQEDSDEFKQWRETGRTYVENGRTKQQMPHDWQFYEDYKLNEHRLSIQRAVQNMTIPQLIVHGSLDPTVPISEAKKTHNWNPTSRLAIISDSNHVFGSSHPWFEEKLPADLDNAISLSLEFIEDAIR